jgi:hypothetical protein
MRKIEVVRADERQMRAGFPALRCRLTGSARSRTASPTGASIWMLTAELDEGSTLSWDARHGDEALFVERGELSFDGRICPGSGQMALEVGRVATLLLGSVC